MYAVACLNMLKMKIKYSLNKHTAMPIENILVVRQESYAIHSMKLVECPNKRIF